MKELAPLEFDRKTCKEEIEELGRLLAQKEQFNERELLKFFRTKKQLTGFLASYMPAATHPDCIASEFQLFGSFGCDFVAGSKKQQAYCFIEFEDAKHDSVFRKAGKKATKEWSRRFEHGFSQLVDWFWKLDVQKDTFDFRHAFGQGHVRCLGVLVCGRSRFLNEEDRHRMVWRTDRVLINSQSIICVTFDDVYRDLLLRI